MQARSFLGFFVALTAARAEAAPITGIVVDEGGTAIAGARVRVQATSLTAESGRDGRFRLTVPGAGVRVVAAWKHGYLNGGARLEPGARSGRIVLEALPREDFSSRAWASALGTADKACGRCHPAVAAAWASSAHATAATNPLFLAIYQGAAGPGYRRDFPDSAGNCATCHVPALAVEAPFAADPRHVAGVAAEGVFCDFCHKIQSATLDDSGGRPGVLSLALLRPAPGRNVLFGPLDDVVARRDSFSPLYRQSRYCAPCHQGRFWNVSAYSEFEEWAASSYARRGIQCQDCHMRSAAGPPRRVALEEEGGVLRPAHTLSSHALAGTGDLAFMRASVALETDVARSPQAVRVRVRVRNVGAGHHLPSGSPLRNLLLVVEASDGRAALPLLTGGRVPAWAGQGSPRDGDYAGLAGKGFAKILAELGEYPADRERRFAPVFPAPYWRPTVVASDTRIAAGETDVSEYRFEPGTGPVSIRARLIYRRTFRSWGRLDTVDTIRGKDLELATSQTRLE